MEVLEFYSNLPVLTLEYDKKFQLQASDETADTASTVTDDGKTTDDDKDVDQGQGNDTQQSGMSSCQADDDENNADVSDMETDEREPPRMKSTR